jgi:uncharacterized protein (TIGR02145 family)
MENFRIFSGTKKEELNKTGARGKASRALRSKTFWPSEYKDADLFGFTAVPAGYFNHINGDFENKNTQCVFWSDEDAENQVWCRSLRYDSKRIERSSRPRPNGYSVRCLKD